MQKTKRTLRAENITKGHVMHLAFELSLNKWKQIFGYNGTLEAATSGGTNMSLSLNL